MPIFQKKTPFGELREDNSEVIWRGVGKGPDKDCVRQWSLSLPVAPKSMLPNGGGVVGRELDYLIGWAKAYIQTTVDLLDNEFVSDSKKYEILFLKSPDLSEIDVVVRLSTVGNEGWSQYRIAWRRVQIDDQEIYFCLE